MHVLTALDCITKDPEERVNVQPTRYGANGNLFVKVASSGKGYGEGGVFLPVIGVRYHPEAFLDGGHDNNLGKCFKLLVIFSQYLNILCMHFSAILTIQQLDFTGILKPVCLPPWENIDLKFEDDLGMTFQ